ncbi:MAG TPA: glycosyltransferase, partial [Mycobacteriales bacterium]|nr:glycosyltransferase [Mycobacteriales bacterium]
AVGRLHPQKGYEVLVAAAARCARRDPVPLVVVAGNGPLESRIRAQADRVGAPVRLLGRRDDVAELMSAADVVVLPSRWEARSLVAQEALHAGRPLVATAVGGLPGLLGDGAALVPPGDVDAFDRAVRELLDDPGRAGELAARGRARARTWPTEEDTAAQARAVYAELLGLAG